MLVYTQKTSPVLVELFTGQLSNVIDNPKLTHLVSCFLDPSLMTRAQTTDGTTDPVYLLFNREDGEHGYWLTVTEIVNVDYSLFIGQMLSCVMP